MNIAKEFGLTGDVEIDKGHSFQYTISVYLPTEFQKQIGLVQFAPYDAIQRAATESDPSTATKSSADHKHTAHQKKVLQGQNARRER